MPLRSVFRWWCLFEIVISEDPIVEWKFKWISKVCFSVKAVMSEVFLGSFCLAATKDSIIIITCVRDHKLKLSYRSEPDAAGPAANLLWSPSLPVSAFRALAPPRGAGGEPRLTRTVAMPTASALRTIPHHPGFGKCSWSLLVGCKGKENSS